MMTGSRLDLALIGAPVCQPTRENHSLILRTMHPKTPGCELGYFLRLNCEKLSPLSMEPQTLRGLPELSKVLSSWLPVSAT